MSGITRKTTFYKNNIETVCKIEFIDGYMNGCSVFGYGENEVEAQKEAEREAVALGDILCGGDDFK